MSKTTLLPNEVHEEADNVEQAKAKAYEAWSNGDAFMDEKNPECSVECTYLKSL